VAEKVEGLAALTRKLRLLDEDTRKMIRELNLAAAEEAAKVARDKVPIGSSEYDEHPGALYLSIKAKATGSAAYLQAGGGDSGPYAAPIHFGWPAHNIAPQPFLREGALEAEPAIVRQYRFGMDALLHKVGLT